MCLCVCTPRQRARLVWGDWWEEVERGGSQRSQQKSGGVWGEGGSRLGFHDQASIGHIDIKIQGFVYKASGGEGLSLIVTFFVCEVALKYQNKTKKRIKSSINSKLDVPWRGRDIYHHEIQNPGGKCSLWETLYICIHTHIYILYIYIYTSHYTWVSGCLKNTDCFTTIAPLTFIIIHSNFWIHTVVVEIGTPALAT